MPTSSDGEDRRRALIVATGTYADTTLAKLRAPGRDAEQLAAILGDAAVGGFDVDTLLDVPADGVRRRVAEFCAQGSPGDLALVYISCHGVLDDRGRLYYATTDTDRELLAATAIPAAWLNEQLDDCRCRQQIVILDCCHSGAFAKGSKGDGALALQERFEGRGRVVLTASRATEYSFEGDQVRGDGVSSVFTDVLVQGLRSGDADRDGDGIVTITELYDYAYEAVRSRDGRQTPMLWTYGAEGGLLVAHSVRGVVVEPEPLSDEMVALLESSRPRVRESAVAELAELLTGPDPGRALTARAYLERVAAEDIRRVAALARAALESAPPSDDGSASALPSDEPANVKPLVLPAQRGGPSRRVLVAVGAAALVAVLAVVGVAVWPDPPAGSDPGKNASTGKDASPVPSSGTIPMDGSPRGIAASGDAMWIARHEAHSVRRIRSGSPPEDIEVDYNVDSIAADEEGIAWATVIDRTALVRVDGVSKPILHVVTEQREACDCPPAELVIAFGALWVPKPRKNAIVKRALEGEPKGGAKQLPHWRLPAGFDGRFAAAGPQEQALWAVGAEQNDSVWIARIDAQEPGAVERYALDAVVHPGGVAYGAGAVWITDDDRNTLVRFDPKTLKTATPITIEDGVTSDDIVALDDAVLLWNPDSGKLTRVDPDTRQADDPISVDGYQRWDDPASVERHRNLLSSDLAVADGVAWITDPARGKVFRVKY